MPSKETLPPEYSAFSKETSLPMNFALVKADFKGRTSTQIDSWLGVSGVRLPGAKVVSLAILGR